MRKSELSVSGSALTRVDRKHSLSPLRRQGSISHAALVEGWIPAFAGMTAVGGDEVQCGLPPRKTGWDLASCRHRAVDSGVRRNDAGEC